VAQKNVTTSFSKNIIAPEQALCSITPSDVFIAPGCSVNQAFATIVEGFDPEYDVLTVPAQSKQTTAMFTQYSGINNLPPSVNATWNQLDGILRFYSNDNKKSAYTNMESGNAVCKTWVIGNKLQHKQENYF